MFLRSVVLGSAVSVAFASSGGCCHLVDDADIKLHGATLENISQCPATTRRTFHHDGMQKDQHAEATFHFDPPRDGCYIIEEAWKLAERQKCEASANTKVHVHYEHGLQAVGTVDQTPKGFERQPQDQWTFIATLQFNAGHPGNVTLSNEGTEPGTLTVFDQVRFSWSGNDCFEAHAHPRRAEIRMTVDFQHVANRLTIFGIALKKRLAGMSGVPEDSLRLTGWGSGAVTAEFLVLPIVVDGRNVQSARELIKRLGIALTETKNVAELCALSEGPLEGCNVELKDVGYAKPSVKALQPLPIPQAKRQALEALAQEKRTQQQQENDTQADGIADVIPSANSSIQLYETKVPSVEALMKNNEKSIVCPSISDQQTKPALCGDIENVSTPEQSKLCFW